MICTRQLYGSQLARRSLQQLPARPAEGISSLASLFYRFQRDQCDGPPSVYSSVVQQRKLNSALCSSRQFASVNSAGGKLERQLRAGNIKPAYYRVEPDHTHAHARAHSQLGSRPPSSKIQFWPIEKARNQRIASNCPLGAPRSSDCLSGGPAGSTVRGCRASFGASDSLRSNYFHFNSFSRRFTGVCRNPARWIRGGPARKTSVWPVHIRRQFGTQLFSLPPPLIRSFSGCELETLSRLLSPT